MTKRTVTLVYALKGGEIQAWTFEMTDRDILELMQKYDGQGVSVLGDAWDIANEVKEIYR